MKITFITVSSPAIEYMIQGAKRINESYVNALDLKLYYAVSELNDKKLEKLVLDIEDADLVFVDLMGTAPKVINAVYKGLEKAKGHIVPYGNSAMEYMKLGSFTMESMSSKKSEGSGMNMEAMKKMQNMAEKLGKVMPGKMRDMRNYSLIMKYFKLADAGNMYNMLLLFLSEYGNLKINEKIEPPHEAKSIAICNPKNMKTYKDYKEYLLENPYDSNKGTVAMLFYGHVYPTDTSFAVNYVKEKLEQFVNVISIAISGTFAENEKKLKEILLNANSVDLILNFMSFRLGAGPMGGDFNAGIDVLKEVNVPYMHPFFMSRRTIKSWEESVEGCTSSEIMISVLLPELDGSIEFIPVGAMDEEEYNEEFDVVTEKICPIPERVDRLVNRVRKQIDLRKKPNKDKKVAIICYNYPPGEANLFGGAFLDTFASVESLLKTLKEQGYDTNDLSKEELMNIFTAGKAVNSGKYDCNWDEMIKYNVKNYISNKEIEDTFGKAPGTIMAEDNDFLIPGTVEKNVFIGLQPSRGIYEDVEKSYHDKSIPPHHQYVAFYKWLRDEFKADAIIHVGTHGTLEFLKGKECGISGKCYPDILMGNVPHMYLYYCGNPAESTIAKRRSYANLIGYQPPVFVEGSLYGEYLELSTEIDNYYQALSISKESANDILNNVMKMAENLNLPKDLEKIEKELYRMSVSLIPKGLHVFGESYTKEEGETFALGLLRYNRNGVKSIYDLVEEANNLNSNNRDDRNNIEILAKTLFNEFMENRKLPKKDYINSSNEKEFLKTLNYGADIAEAVLENNEFKGLIKTLNGEYNEAKLAGDIYRNPEVLPTGGNLYQFDPKLIPTRTAFERGKKICDATLKSFLQEENEYPKSTAVILWGLETSRTQGETVAQVLSYLGVRMAKDSSPWNIKFEIVPINELNRPRIDVTINICGFFRDMFPNLIESLNDLFMKIYELDEDDSENYFKAHYKVIYKKLLEEGYSEEEAKELAVSRIFGPKEGEYGTGITDIIGTKNWQQEEEIGESFISSLKHVYNRHSRGRKVDGLYEDNLKCVDIVSQLRSNHEYEITDLDHYYEFFGGLAKSVEMVKGKKAKMLITDTTGENIETEGVENSIARGIRTRVLNPKWIDGMLEHKYHGAQKIADRFENVMGLAATTNSVEEWIYEDLNKNYVDNEELRNRMIENNPHAYMKILEQMMEYSNRGYWNATEEQIEKIKEIYLEIEDNIEEEL